MTNSVSHCDLELELRLEFGVAFIALNFNISVRCLYLSPQRKGVLWGLTFSVCLYKMTEDILLCGYDEFRL